MPDFHNDEHRNLQDRFDSRALADTLQAATVKHFIDDAAKTFIEARAFFFLSTSTATGHPIAHRSFDLRTAPERRDRGADLFGYLRTVK